MNLPAACFVTAATTPPPSFPFFLSFFAPFMVRTMLAEWTMVGHLCCRWRRRRMSVLLVCWEARGETNLASE